MRLAEKRLDEYLPRQMPISTRGLGCHAQRKRFTVYGDRTKRLGVTAGPLNTASAVAHTVTSGTLCHCNEGMP